MKIAIIKLGALGDVVRTTPILEAIKEKYPESEITWITKPASREILEGNPKIDKILETPCKIEEEFDILYSVDIDETATQLANEINAKEKIGYYNLDGFPASFNLEAEYYLNTVFDDPLKKSNNKTYQEMIFEAMKLDWKNQKIELFLDDKSKNFANSFLQENNLVRKKLLGINIGSSKRWPSKAWHLSKIQEFIPLAQEQGYEVVLIWGDSEKESIDKLSNNLSEKGIRFYKTDTRHSLKDFFALINICDKILTADSFALHAALAFNKPTTGLFFCTSPNEIEGYGLIDKIVSPQLNEFFPEKSDQYDESLVNSISVDAVIESINKNK